MKGREHRCLVEYLEQRTLLSAGKATHTFILDSSPAAVVTGYTPQQLETAYGTNAIKVGSVVGDGSGQTIAIVDAYDDPGFVSSTSANFIFSDLHEFDSNFGLADPPSFTKLDQNGGINYPTTDPAGPGSSWAVEESLDVEWAHVIAPKANIVLFEANDPSSQNLYAAVNTARNYPGVSAVSMSFGGPETTGDPGMNSVFTTPAGHQGVTFLAATGDYGAPSGYPAYSPNVVAVGGTTLFVNPDSSYNSELGWSGSGGGQSLYESEPTYQQSVESSGARENPDVSFEADPNTGVPVYDTYDFGAANPWAQIGGTSLATPCWGALVAIADQMRATQGSDRWMGLPRPCRRFTLCPQPIFTTLPSVSTAYIPALRAMTW